MLSIATLKSSQGKPYQTTLKCVIATRSEPIKYQKDGTVKTMMYVAFCDHSGHIKATVYDLSKLENIANLTTIIIKNFILRSDHTLALTTQTKIFKTAPLQLADNIITEAINSVRPPTPPPQPIKTVKTSPIKTTTSVKGSVKEDEVPRKVMVRGEEVKVRTITLQDEEDTIKVSLWRDDASTTISTGDYVAISNVTVKSYQGEVQLGSTSRTNIKKMECPDVQKKIQIVGYIEEETDFHLLIDDDTMLSIDKDLLRANINAEKFDEWQQALDFCLPLALNVNIRQGHITKVITE